MLSKCYTQYVSKFGKPSSGHRNGKGQSSSQFPRKAVLNNVQITGQLHSSLMIVRFCSKSYMPGFNSMWTMNLQKIFKELGIPDHLTCLLRNLYAGQEATVRNGHETTDWFQIGKGVRQGCILSPCLFNLYAENIMRNAGLEWIKHNLDQDSWEKYQ